MTPTDTIIALEKALEAGPTPGEWTLWGRAEPSQTIASADGFIAQTVGGNDSPNAQWIAACSPLAIRTLLDAHASALRDAGKLRAKLDALDNLPAEEFIRKIARQMGPPPFDTWPVSHVCQQNADEAVELVAEYDRLAALDDNTKGAAE
jgi:hypothetical protein